MVESNGFTHLDKNGQTRMVDVGDKLSTKRVAIAVGKILMQKKTFKLIADKKIKKGNVLETARIAGIMATKKTSEIIPMCHPLNVTHIKIDFEFDKKALAIDIEAKVSLIGKTGVEMEALTAVLVSGLTIYDMCKSYDKTMQLTDIYLKYKSGGKNGTYDLQK